MRLRIGWLLLSAFGALGCAGAPASPKQANEANEHWLRLETEHFDVATNLPSPEAHAAAEALERTRHAMLVAAWNKADDRITQRTTVVIFREIGDYHHYRPHTRGAYVAAVRPTIFIYGAPGEWERRTALSYESSTSVLRHELTHRLAAGVYGRQPRWFAEGLAQFLETMALSEDGRTATLGRLNLEALGNYRSCRGTTVAEALAWGSDRDLDDRTRCGLYGTSFLLVHYLYNTKGAEFATYQTKLALGVEPKLAFTESFPDLARADLDQELNRYSKHGEFTELTRPVDAIAVAMTPAVVTAADVLAIRAQFAFVGSPELRKEAQADADGALSLDPGHALALRLTMLLRTFPKDAPERLRAHVERRPDDAEAWRLLGSLLPVGSPERETALRKAMALKPRDADTVNALAWELAATGRAAAALPFATKAALLAPWDPVILDTYAMTLGGVGRCADALKTERKALELLSESASREAAPYAQKIAAWEAACGAASPPTTP